MNYFELYDLPVSLSPDKALVKQKFCELSRKHHPDLHGNADADEQTEVLEKSSTVSKAFKVFNNNDETLKYVLQLKGLLQEEEKYQLSADFLMEMMDINEQLTDAKTEGDQSAIDKVKSAIVHLQSEIYAPVKQDIEGYKEGVTSQEALLRVKDYYFKKKYLNRILEGLES